MSTHRFCLCCQLQTLTQRSAPPRSLPPRTYMDVHVCAHLHAKTEAPLVLSSTPTWDNEDARSKHEQGDVNSNTPWKDFCPPAFFLLYNAPLWQTSGAIPGCYSNHLNVGRISGNLFVKFCILLFWEMENVNLIMARKTVSRHQDYIFFKSPVV